MHVRRQFLFTAKGHWRRQNGLIIQARRRQDHDPASDHIALTGFTATRKIGNAVTRNRARRRLRECARQILPELGLGGVNYVFIARRETVSVPWTKLLLDARTALTSLHCRLIDA